MIYMEIYYIVVYLLLFGLGASLTSFMIALIYRIENQIPYPDILVKGSHCEKCDKQLKWYELIPVISYLIFLGKCAKCGYKIAISYPILEAGLGIAFIIFFYSGADPISYFIATALYFLALYDFYHFGFPKVVMNIFLGVGFITSLALLLVQYERERVIAVIVSLVIGGMIFLINRFKESFGIGDILVIIFLGFLISVEQLALTLLISIFFGAVVGMVMISTGNATRKSHIPFVPCIWVGYIGSFLLLEKSMDFFATYFLV